MSLLYQRYKDTITNYRNKEENKKKFSQYQKDRRENNREKTKIADKKSYDKKMNDRIDCDCGRKAVRYSYKKHVLTAYHIKHLKTN